MPTSILSELFMSGKWLSVCTATSSSLMMSDRRRTITTRRKYLHRKRGVSDMCGGSKVELSNGLCSISLAIPELEIQSSEVELINGICSISLAIPELEIQSSEVELTNGICSISLAIPELEIQSSEVELTNALCSISLAIPEQESHTHIEATIHTLTPSHPLPSPQPHVGTGECLIRLVHLLEVEGVGFALCQLPGRVQLPHEGQEVVVVTSVVVHLNLPHKLHSDTIVVELAALQSYRDLQE